ncbi:MAG: hypothetical protein LBU09_02920 [Endomicrobium sp.]|jgi:hypothetical protein|nr:hypothetical protein [Endomicrobium sp.]
MADNNRALAVFENFEIRRHYDEKAEKWYFSVVDIMKALIGKQTIAKRRCIGLFSKED